MLMARLGSDIPKVFPDECQLVAFDSKTAISAEFARLHDTVNFILLNTIFATNNFCGLTSKGFDYFSNSEDEIAAAIAIQLNDVPAWQLVGLI